MRSIKELHFFDALDAGQLGRRGARLNKEIAQLRAEVSAEPSIDRVAKIADREAWLPVLASGRTDDYLAYLHDGLADRHLIADVTPAYALLPTERLRDMAMMAPDVRFVYLMRDPVARLWSHVRMLAWRKAGNPEMQAAKVFEAVLAGQQPDVTDRGDYRAALERLDAAIDPSRLLVMFQEAMLTVPGVKRLCAFLGIADHEADFSRRVHAGQRLDMTQDQLARARAALRPQYDYVAARFGTLPDAWLRNMNEGVA